jgi:DNA-binding IclR family transcriptional regulator
MQSSATIEKAMEVLFHLHAAGDAQGVSAIGRALGLPKSTTHRLVTALGRGGLVERDEHGRYRPGMALVALGLGVLEHEPVVAAAEPIMEQSALAVGETLFLATARSGRLLVLDKREGSGFLRASPRVGAELPVHATAIGKVYLAFAPELAAASALDAHTPKTITDSEVLVREVASVAERGWAQNYDEWIPGVAGLAAPVFLRGKLVAALAIAGPIQRMTPATSGPFVDEVTSAARRIGARLEGRFS